MITTSANQKIGGKKKEKPYIGQDLKAQSEETQ
jgi:hypothetical protein